MKVKKRMIVLSLDAVGSSDLDFMRSLPNFRDYFGRAAGCEQVNSVYPSLTYPAHTSIVTGNYPGRHGIVNNLRVQPDREPSDWFWQRKYIRCTTLYDEAIKSKMTTAALLWPVTGRSRIRYNLPEVLPNRPWQSQISVSFSNGSPLYELKLQAKFGHLRDGVRQPQLDNFVHASMMYTLRTYRPELMLVHLTDVDTNRHLYGVRGPEAEEALRRHDKRLGELISLLKDMKRYENTDVVILGDHYQMDVGRAVYPNYLLLKNGLLTVKRGRISEWDAVARDCDGCCYIYVKNKRRTGEVRDILEKAAAEGEGIERLLSAAEARALGADPDCAFMLEAKPGYYFQNGWQSYCVPVTSGVRNAPASDHHFSLPWQTATHGYLPDRDGYRTIFFAAGPSFRAGASVERMNLVDEGPTLALALGLDLGDVDGSAARELLRDSW